MNVIQPDIDLLIETWDKISKEAEAYLDGIWQILIREAGGIEKLERHGRAIAPEYVAEADSNGTVASLTKEIPRFIAKLVEASKSSPLVSDVDRVDLRVCMREMLAALKLRRYEEWGTNILNDEDRGLGVEPP